MIRLTNDLFRKFIKAIRESKQIGYTKDFQQNVPQGVLYIFDRLIDNEEIDFSRITYLDINIACGFLEWFSQFGTPYWRHGLKMEILVPLFWRLFGKYGESFTSLHIEQMHMTNVFKRKHEVGIKTEYYNPIYLYRGSPWESESENSLLEWCGDILEECDMECERVHQTFLEADEEFESDDLELVEKIAPYFNVDVEELVEKFHVQDADIEWIQGADFIITDEYFTYFDEHYGFSVNQDKKTKDIFILCEWSINFYTRMDFYLDLYELSTRGEITK
ncbi:hypothetical protein [Bacillus cereus]|uniref:hypothetical protein n=1 Tax=Bacillus cereus TaxID=1396 RepID=UPI00187A12BF|nr:hypothetical protein [Bacillus cereus]MBE7123144.1 hypothetical protein [Bacillus cereus]